MADPIIRFSGTAWPRVAAVLCIAAIGVLSLMPNGGQEPGKELLHGLPQHGLAYAVTAVLLGLSARRRVPIIQIVAPLALCSGVLEILQNWSPTRTPEWNGFLASSLGAVLGALLVTWLRRDTRDS